MKKIIVLILFIAPIICFAQNPKADSLQRVCDSLKTKLFVSNYKIARINYYLRICLKNPKQDKFLKGWILRTLKK